MNIFSKPCITCGASVLGPREGGKARGRWLGYDECPACRDKAIGYPEPHSTEER